jgi:DNA-binding NarL/FixJ family response regulator
MEKTAEKSVWHILIADDHELVRRGTRSLLESLGSMRVTEVANGREAIEKTQELNPDLVLLDISMPVLDGFSAAREIRRLSPHTRILIVSLNRTEAFVDVARKIGVSGYVTKSEGSAVLLRVVTAALEAPGFHS